MACSRPQNVTFKYYRKVVRRSWYFAVVQVYSLSACDENFISRTEGLWGSGAFQERFGHEASTLMGCATLEGVCRMGSLNCSRSQDVGTTHSSSLDVESGGNKTPSRDQNRVLRAMILDSPASRTVIHHFLFLIIT